MGVGEASSKAATTGEAVEYPESAEQCDWLYGPTPSSSNPVPPDVNRSQYAEETRATTEDYWATDAPVYDHT